MKYFQKQLRLSRRGFVIFMILLLGSPMLQAGEPYLSSEEALMRVQKNELILVDIRTPGEWGETGVASPAMLISMHRSGFLEKMLDAVSGDKTKPIALICARGGRSNKMQGVLVKAGFTTVYDVPEGMLGTFTTKGWIDKKLPMRKVTP